MMDAMVHGFTDIGHVENSEASPVHKYLVHIYSLWSISALGRGDACFTINVDKCIARVANSVPI